MRRRTDLAPDERCSVPHCRSEAQITYCGVRLCNDDWRRVSAMPLDKAHAELGIAQYRKVKHEELSEDLRAVTRPWSPANA